MAVRVVLAEDNLLVREGVQRLLESRDSVEVVDVCADRDELARAIATHLPDVVVTDIRMPPTRRTEGIDVANALRDSHPSIGVLVLSQYVEPQYAVALFRGGSERRGYLLKERLADARQLLDAIDEIAAGGSVIDPRVVEALVAGRGRASESRLHELTPRELQILGEVASGKSNAAIAEKLVISKRAVEHHVGSIFTKLNLADEAEVSRRVTAALLFLTEATPETAEP